nr:MAG: coat protein [Chemarfal virus 156]
MAPSRKQQPKPQRKPSASKRQKQSRSVPSARSLVHPQGFAQPQIAMQTGRPQFISQKDRIIVSNTEIALELNGTAAAGLIPAGGGIRVFRFQNVSTGVFMDNTRWLTKLAKAYDKFRINKLNLRWVTSIPFTYGGQVALRWDSDPSKVTPDSDLLSVSGDMRAMATAVYNSIENRVMKDQLNRLPQYETFPAAGDTGIATVGSINVAHSPITLPTSHDGIVNLGYVWMDYEVEFYNPSAATA